MKAFTGYCSHTAQTDIFSLPGISGGKAAGDMTGTADTSPAQRFLVRPFLKNGKPLIQQQAPHWGMSLKAAGSMRFRWNENNQNRTSFLTELASSTAGRSLTPVSLELIHSHTVYALTGASDTAQKTGDGMITTETSLIPVVTVADCMPIFLYDPVSGVFGALHSGWKGTGIVQTALELAQKNYGAHAEDFCVVLGPHIHDCCYTVQEDRAAYFAQNFCAECVTVETDNSGAKKYRLSLAAANLAVLMKAGVTAENITVCTNCTSCDERFGSFRREARGVQGAAFTVQAAFCGFVSGC